MRIHFDASLYVVFYCTLSRRCAARFAILFASQTHVHSDEAIIGLMGKQTFLEGRHFPFYMYGQHIQCRRGMGSLSGLGRIRVFPAVRWSR